MGILDAINLAMMIVALGMTIFNGIATGRDERFDDNDRLNFRS